MGVCEQIIRPLLSRAIKLSTPVYYGLCHGYTNELPLNCRDFEQTLEFIQSRLWLAAKLEGAFAVVRHQPKQTACVTLTAPTHEKINNNSEEKCFSGTHGLVGGKKCLYQK